MLKHEMMQLLIESLHFYIETLKVMILHYLGFLTFSENIEMEMGHYRDKDWREMGQCCYLIF